MAPFVHRHQQEQPFVYSWPSALPVLFSADTYIGLIAIFLILISVLVWKSILTDGCLQQISLKKSPSKPTHANLNTDDSNSNHIYHEEQHSVQHFLFYLPQVEPIFYLSTTCMYIMLQVDRYFFIYTPLPNQILQQIGHSREDFDVNTKVVYNII